MERLVFDLDSAPAAPPGGPGTARGPAAGAELAATRRPAVLVGVVASGNLEVLVEPGPAPGRCHVEVATSAGGFREIWEAVLRDFAARRPVAGLSLSVNDAGATPAVVALRLEQAVEEFLGQAP
jgi:malonate decarboxylase delta subunit